MATTDRIWLTDPEVEDQILNILTRLNGAGSLLELFTNSDIDPDSPLNPEMETADFDVPTLDGYAPVDLEDLWTTPARDEAGVWSSQTEIISFTTDPAETDSELIYGVFIRVSTETKIFAPFDAPVTWEHGAPLRTRVVFTQYAALSFKIIVLS